MKIPLWMVAVACLGITGCATTETPNAETERNRQPAPDKVAPVAAAVEKSSAPDDLAAVRDPKNPLSKRSVYFDFDAYIVKPEFVPLLEHHAKFLAGRSAVKIMVQGHADERGSHEYNLALGQRRAEAVKRALSIYGVKEVQLEAVSFGEEKPRSSGHNEAAWSQNRRADIAYPGEY